MDKGELLLNDDVVDSLRREIREGTYGLSTVPRDIVTLIDRDMWRERLVKKLGKVVEFEEFKTFAATLPLEGLGTSRKELLDLCHGHPDAQKKIKQAWPMTGDELADEPLPDGPGPGRGNKTIGNTNSLMSSSNDATYAEARLAKHRPDLYKRVLAGELSPHKAMIEAGFRDKKFTVSSDIHKAAKTLAKHFDPDELCAVMKDVEA